jgi:hypothetical protein
MIKAEGFHVGRVRCQKGFSPAPNTMPQTKQILKVDSKLSQSSGFRPKSENKKTDARMWFDYIHGRVEWTESGLGDQER